MEVGYVHQLIDLLSTGNLGALLGEIDPTFARKRFAERKRIHHSTPLILVVLPPPLDSSRLHRQGVRVSLSKYAFQ